MPKLGFILLGTAVGGLAVSCAFEWDPLDPRLETDPTGGPTTTGAGGDAGGADATGGTSSPGGAGGIGGANGPGGSGGSGGGGCVAPRTLCGDDCVDLSRDLNHCGECGTVCASDEVCGDNDCRLPTSCGELLQARPSAAQGVHPIAPAASAPFNAHCDMTIDGGGWTLVASVADNSYFTGTRCVTECGMNPATVCDETPFTADDVEGDVMTMLTADHKSAAYATVAFDEMLFIDSNDQWVSYEVSGDNVRDWFPVGLLNWVPSNVEAHDTFSYPAKNTNIDPTLNGCGTLRVSINAEDSDSMITSTCHVSVKGPAWTNTGNNSCYWDDVNVSFENSAFYRGNGTTYRLWLVR